MLLAQEDLADSEGISIVSEINHISKICTRDLRTPRAAPGRQACLAKFDCLPILQHRKATLNIELANKCSQSNFDAFLFVPFIRLLDDFVESDGRILKKRLRERRPLIRKVGLVTDERHRAFGVILAQCITDTGPTNAAADDQVITLDHAIEPPLYGGAGIFSKKFLRFKLCFLYCQKFWPFFRPCQCAIRRNADTPIRRRASLGRDRKSVSVSFVQRKANSLKFRPSNVLDISNDPSATCGITPA